MDKIFEYQTEIFKNGKGYEEILLAFQNAAAEHLLSIGWGLDRIISQNMGWAVLDWNINIFNIPKLNEKVTIKTWVSTCRRRMSKRYFEVIDSKNSLMIKASSKWAFIDLLKRSPITMPKEMEEDCIKIEMGESEKTKFGVPKEEPENLILDTFFIVRRDDIDENGHANNTRYLKWAMDTVPEFLVKDINLKEIKAEYRKECKEGDCIRIKIYIKENEDGKEILFVFFDESEENVLARFYTFWA